MGEIKIWIRRGRKIWIGKAAVAVSDLRGAAEIQLYHCHCFSAVSKDCSKKKSIHESVKKYLRERCCKLNTVF